MNIKSNKYKVASLLFDDAVVVPSGCAPSLCVPVMSYPHQLNCTRSKVMGGGGGGVV